MRWSMPYGAVDHHHDEYHDDHDGTDDDHDPKFVGTFYVTDFQHLDGGQHGPRYVRSGRGGPAAAASPQHANDDDRPSPNSSRDRSR